MRGAMTPDASSPALAAPTVPVPDLIIALAASTGGLPALVAALGPLPRGFPAVVLVVQHLSASYPSRLADILGWHLALPVIWGRDGAPLQPKAVAVAPPGAHLLVMDTGRLSLSDGPRIHRVRPAADLLFASVAAYAGARAIGVVLSGLGCDGAAGACAIVQAGGRVVAQDATTSEAFAMPGAAIAAGGVKYVVPVTAIAPTLLALARARAVWPERRSCDMRHRTERR
jgi:two-component system chemotaxis response regulator CheB